MLAVSAAEPKPHLFGGAGAVMRCSSVFGTDETGTHTGVQNE
jgi:hypothetical protein